MQNENITCQMCLNKFNNIKALSAHIVKHNIKTNEYYDLYLKKVLQRYTNNPPPSWKGKKHSEQTKEQMSVAAYRRMIKHGIPAASKGPFFPANKEKYRGDVENITYRSTWERRFMMFLDENKSVLEWSSEETYVKYFDPSSQKVRRYYPDFIIKVQRRDGTVGIEMIEIKPYKQTHPPVMGRKKERYLKESLTYATNQAKWKAADIYCNKLGWNFRIITEKELGI
jgi:hypothetical protein